MTARLDVPIRFDTADGTRIHSPMVDAVVGGVATRLILDTGATDHVLLLPLIERSGAKFTPTDDGTDHAGASMRSWSVGMLPVGLGGVRFDLADVVAIEPPARFEQWGVGGFLSPQHLTADARICIDLLTDRLVVEPIDGRDPTDVDAALATRLPGLVPTTHRRDPGEATIVALAGLDGGVVVAAMWNTGGRGTEVARRVAGARAGEVPSARSTGLSGTGVVGSDSGRATMVAGDVRFAVEHLLVRDEMDDPPVLVGMDVLRGTAVIAGADRAVAMTWLVPPSWVTPGRPLVNAPHGG